MEPQTKFVIDYFKGKTGQFFVDVGAYDGVLISNTYPLEKEYGWCGLCLEPNPTVFSKLKQNRRATCLNLAAYNENKILEFTKINGYSEMLSGVKDAYDPRHSDRINNELIQHQQQSEIIQVQAKRLSDIFYDELIYIVDYLSVDTEGSELQVLQGIDFKLINIKLISLEDNFGDKLDDYQKILAPAGYKYLETVGLDRFFGK